eukprot:UN25138
MGSKSGKMVVSQAFFATILRKLSTYFSCKDMAENSKKAVSGPYC